MTFCCIKTEHFQDAAAVVQWRKPQILGELSRSSIISFNFNLQSNHLVLKNNSSELLPTEEEVWSIRIKYFSMKMVVTDGFVRFCWFLLRHDKCSPVTLSNSSVSLYQHIWWQSNSNRSYILELDSTLSQSWIEFQTESGGTLE